MRKKQEKLLESACKNGFSPEQIKVLTREDLPIQELKSVYEFFQNSMSKGTAEDSDNEAEILLGFLKKHKHDIANTNDYKILLNICFGSHLPIYPQSEDLIENTFDITQKKRALKMYIFFLKISQKKGYNETDTQDLLVFYIYLLVKEFPVWHRKTLLREVISQNDHDVLYEYQMDCKANAKKLWWLMNMYPSIIDDFVHNKKNSLFYYIAFERNLIESFWPEKQILDKLYDYETHSFCFKPKEFKNYFKKVGCYYQIDKEYVGKKNVETHPIISLLIDFCTKNGLKPNSEGKIFTTWKLYWLKDSSRLQQLKDSYNILGQKFVTQLESSCLKIEIDHSCFASINFYTYRSVYMDENGWGVAGKPYSIKLLITPDGRLFAKTKFDKNYPIGMDQFLHLQKGNSVFAKLLKLVLKFHQNKNIFYKDVISDFRNCRHTIPLTFNEIGDYHNRAELILAKYKTARNLRINWNKMNLNLSYFIIKAYPLIEPGVSREILIQEKDPTLLKNIDKDLVGCDEKVYAFIKQVLYNKISMIQHTYYSPERVEIVRRRYRNELYEALGTDVLSDEHESWLNERIKEHFQNNNPKRIVEDYVSMCQQSKFKVRLDVRSIPQLENLHNDLATNSNEYRKNTGVVKIPKKSKFLRLRDILPPEFEWIKTRKRLILETELQHHCVWSYANYITKDECAIYSYVDSNAEHTKDGKPKRYTIEFRQSKDGTYYVDQVQGRFDRVNTRNMMEYISSILEKQKQGAV